ncbi:MAG: ABC transporter ATP-binding protein [Candidatus Binatia bacterium]|nr:MAG: ABC transporter ATP-binding protein [Candidatus Binatia bacterium]
MPLLEVHDLRVSFFTSRGEVRAVDGISFSIDEGETFGLVGESGCGKTVTALSILRLLDRHGRIGNGEIVFAGRDLLRLSEDEMRAVRGDQIAMIFQEPMTALNPVFTVGFQIGEVLEIHRGASRKEARAKAIELLRLVDIPEPERRVDQYPHQLSGGMRQRVMIAMALACRPRLLIADEPTTALDVTIQAQILDLLGHLQEQFGMAVLFVTHDLGIVAERARRVAVMYAGRIVEQAPTEELFRRPLHPYTRGLLRSIPRLGARGRRLEAIPGTVPNPLAMPSGCRFRDRCAYAVARCSETDPLLAAVNESHRVACIRAEEFL